MTCPDVRARLADRLDDLLGEEEARALDAHLASCPACAAEAARASRRRALLLAPWDVPAPPTDLPDRLLARSAPRSRAWVGPAVRHALTFAAGLVAGVLLLRADGAAPSPVSSPPRRGRVPPGGLGRPVPGHGAAAAPHPMRLPMRTTLLSALLLSLATALPARADGPATLDGLAEEVAAAVARADAATAWLVTDEWSLPGALVGTPPRFVVAAQPLPDVAQAKVRLADGTEVQAIRLDGDPDLGIAVYDLPGEKTPGLAAVAEWPLRRGTIGVVGGARPDLVLLPGTTALRQDLEVTTPAEGPLLVTPGGRLAGLRVGRGTADGGRVAYGALVALPHGGYQPMRLDPRTGTFVSEDGGATWLAAADGTPAEPGAAARFVPGPVVARALEDLAAAGRIRRPYLGVVTEDGGGRRVVTLARRYRFAGGRVVDGEGQPVGGDRFVVGSEGARLASVLSGSPAAQAGLKAGLTILAIDDVDVPGPEAFARALARRRPGDLVRLTVKGWAGVTEVTLGDLDEARSVLPTVADLGLDCMPIGPDVARFLGLSAEAQGLVVRAVTEGGAAAKAGLRRGDVLLRGGEGPIRDLPELEAVLAAAKGSVRLTVQRDADQVEVEVRLPDRPARKAR